MQRFQLAWAEYESRRRPPRDQYEALLNENDAPRRPPTRADLHSQHDETAKRVVAAGGGTQAVTDATDLRTLKQVADLLDPATLTQAFDNDALAPPQPPPLARKPRPRRRRLIPDAALIQRRAADESLRQLARLPGCPHHPQPLLRPTSTGSSNTPAASYASNEPAKQACGQAQRSQPQPRLTVKPHERAAAHHARSGQAQRQKPQPPLAVEPHERATDEHASRRRLSGHAHPPLPGPRPAAPRQGSLLGRPGRRGGALRAAARRRIRQVKSTGDCRLLLEVRQRPRLPHGSA
jgi:hypothetical protein